MVPFHIELYGNLVDNFGYIIKKALNDSILYHDLFNFTLESTQWVNYKYILDGTTNRIPQGTIEYQFQASVAFTHLYNYLNSTDARRRIDMLNSISSVPPHISYIYSSSDIAWIISVTILAVFTIACIVCIVRLPHKKQQHRQNHHVLSIVDYTVN